MADTIYQLKVTLRGIRPPIWRRLRVPGAVTLARLHDVLQEAFGWTNSHLHQFRAGREAFGVPDRDGWGGPEVIDERRVGLDQVADAKSRLIYEYDFGDG
jgi:pRiA4b ORF-3-like protein